MEFYYVIRNIFYKFFPFLHRYHITRQFIKFCVVGLTNLCVDFLVYVFLTRIFGIYFIVANIGAFAVAVTWSFYWNKRWTFQHEQRKFDKQYVKFIATNFVGVTVQTSLLYVLVSYAGWYDLAAKVFAVALASLWNFSATKFWAFKI